MARLNKTPLTLRVRRGTAAQITATSPAPYQKEGELAYATDTGGFYISNGTQFVLYTGALTALDLQAVTDIGNTTTNSIETDGVTSDYFTFDTSATPTPTTGMMFWDQDSQTPDVQLDSQLAAKMFQDEFWYVKNQTGSQINKGTVVMAVGTLGASSRILVAPMIANGSVPAKYILGIAAENIPDGGDGSVMRVGKIRNLNTTAFAAGDVLYANPAVAGGLTNVLPQAPNLKLAVAFVVHSATNGVLAVRVEVGSDLYEDHRVQVTSPTDGQLLRYDGTDQRWENWTPNFLTTVPTLDQVTTAGNTSSNPIAIGTTSIPNLSLDTKLYLQGSGSGTSGRTAFAVKNTNSSSAAAFRLYNSNDDFIAFQVSGPSYAVPSEAGVSVNDAIDLSFIAGGNVASGATNKIGFRTGGYAQDFAMTILGNKNVLIGTTTDAGYKLDVNGTFRATTGTYATTSGLTVDSNGEVVVGGTTGTGGGRAMTVNGVARFNDNVELYGELRIGDVGADQNTVYNIKSGGALRINSNIQSTDANFDYLDLIAGATNSSSITIHGNFTSGRILFRVRGSERMRISDAGNLLVGTTTDNLSNKLQIDGTISATGGTSTNWNTAYSWGNHATVGYLTAESDTLDSVTGRGNTTTNDITVSSHVNLKAFNISTISVGNNNLTNFSLGGNVYAYGTNILSTATIATETFAFGDSALRESAFSYFNIAIGTGAGRKVQKSAPEHTIGGGNVLIGVDSGGQTDLGFENLFIGRLSGYYMDSSYNIAIGARAGGGDPALLTQGFNIYLGHSSGKRSIGGDNVFIGYQSGVDSTKSNWFILGNRNNSGLIEGNFSSGNVLIGTSTDNGTNRLQVNGSISATGGTSTNWNDAFSWGNHALAGYLTSFTETDPTVPGHVKAITTTQITNWDTAYSWGNHALAGYLTSYTETDTLDSVVTRGNTTTQTMYVGPLINATGSFNSKLELSGEGGFHSSKFTFNNQGRFIAGQVNVKGTNDIFFQAAPSTTSGFGFLETWQGAGMVVGTGGNSNPVIFQVNRIERARISSTGNLLVGTTVDSGLGKLQVNGVITATGGTSTDWNTAFGWGNHASVGYLTSEVDTLDSVTSRGNITTNPITVGNLVVNTTNQLVDFRSNGPLKVVFSNINNPAPSFGTDGFAIHTGAYGTGLLAAKGMGFSIVPNDNLYTGTGASVFLQSGSFGSANAPNGFGVGAGIPYATRLYVQSNSNVVGATSVWIAQFNGASTTQRLGIRNDGVFIVNTDALYVHANKNITIGGTVDSGLHKLQVVGNISATGGDSDQWNTAYSWGNHATVGYLTSQPWTISGSNIYYNTGSVGIGTTTPLAKLDIEQGGSGLNDITTILAKGVDSNFRIVTTQNKSTNGQVDPIGTLALVYNTGINSAIRFHRGSSATGGFMSFSVNANIEAARIFTNGNFLINNTIDGGFKLDVNGTTRLAGNTFVTGGLGVKLSSGLSSDFDVNGFARIRIDLGVDRRVYVGDFLYVGTSTFSGYKLDVNGSARAGSFVKTGGTASEFLKADGSVDSNVYLTSFTETDPTVPSHVKAITTTQVSNWDLAYSWGNHAVAGYLKTRANVHTAIYSTGGDANTYAEFGIYRNYGVSGPVGTTHSTFLNVMQPDGNYGFQLVSRTSASIEGLYFREKDAAFSTWKQVASREWVTGQNYLTSYTETDPTVPSHVKAITTTQVSNWDTAFGWGNHASAGYLTSFTEADTLNTVTGRGNSTTNSITVGGLIVDTNTLVVDSVNNRVGIGTTTPNYPFEVASTLGKYLFRSNAEAQDVGIYFSTPYTLANPPRAAIIGKALNNWNRIDLYFCSNNVVGSNPEVSIADVKMVVKADGTVGIGTTTPTTKFEVVGSGKFGSSGETTSIGAAGIYMSRFYSYLAPTSNNSQSLFLGDVNAGVLDWALVSIKATTTEIFSTTARIVTGGVERFRVNSTGNVGIATNDPKTRLHIGAEVIDDNNYSYDSNALMVVHQTPTSSTVLNDPKEVLILARQGTGSQAYGAAAAFDLSRYENSGVNARTRLDIRLANGAFLSSGQNTVVMTMLSSGNIGIGTTNPTSILDVRRDSTTGQFATYRNNNGFFLHRTYANYANQGTIIEYQERIGVDGNFGSVGMLTDHNFYIRTNSTNRITVLNSGNVGINVATPSERLEVAGNIKIGDGTGLVTDLGPLIGRYNSSQVYIATSGYSIVQIGRADGGALNVLPGGNVGIGNNNPTSKLSVNGDVNFSSTLKVGGGTSNGRMLEVSGTSIVVADFRNTGNVGSYIDIIGSAGANAQMRLGVFGSNIGITYGADQVPDFVISSSTNIGIGNTSPVSKLHVTGGSADWNETTPGVTSGTIHLSPASTDNFGNALTFGASDTSSGNNAQAGIYVRSDGNYGTKMYFATTDAYISGSKTRMFIGHDGNVGINTTAPSEKLHVQGTIYASSGNITTDQSFIVNTTSATHGLFITCNNPTIQMVDTVGGSDPASINNYNGSFYYTTNHDHYFFKTGSATSTLRLTNTQNVLVGTDTDNGLAKLQVNGGITALLPPLATADIVYYNPATQLFSYGPVPSGGSGTVTSVSGTGTVSGLTLSGTVTTSGSLTLGGTLSASINNITDVPRIFNNSGDSHSIRTSFDATTASINFGWRYVQGNTNGPAVNSAAQYYSLYVGLGDQYPATGTGSYGMQIAFPRNVTNPYLAIRYNENNSIGAWQKISAVYADTAGSASTVNNGVYTNSSAAISGDNHITFGPNSTWASSIRIGGNGRTVSGETFASVVTTNGNLHLDGGNNKATYINYYAGTGGVAFGNGGSGVAAWMGSDGDLWKGSADNVGTQYVYNSGTWGINTTGSAASLTTARTFTIGNTGKTFNGTANVSWTLAEIGAYAATNPNGYISSYTETDTLDSVTTRGNITANSITTGGYSTTGNLLVGGTSTLGGNVIIGDNTPQEPYLEINRKGLSNESFKIQLGDGEVKLYSYQDEPANGYGDYLFRGNTYKFNEGLLGNLAQFSNSLYTYFGLVGNVGIGTTSPTDTNSYGRALDIQSGAGSAVYLRDSDDTSKYFLSGFAGQTTNHGIIGTWGANTLLRIFTSGDEKMRITSAGNLLVGNTIDSGGYKLDVNGNARFSGTVEAVGGDSSEWNQAYLWGDHSTAGYLQSGVGWTGTIMIPTNPPGMQNIDVVDGLIMNVF